MRKTKFIVETGNIIAEVLVDEDIFEGVSAYIEAGTRVFEIVFGLREPKDGYDILALLDDYDENVLEKDIPENCSDEYFEDLLEQESNLPQECADIVTHIRKSYEPEENERIYLSSIIFKNAGLPSFAAEAERQEQEIKDIQDGKDEE